MTTKEKKPVLSDKLKEKAIKEERLDWLLFRTFANLYLKVEKGTISNKETAFIKEYLPQTKLLNRMFEEIKDFPSSALYNKDIYWTTLCKIAIRLGILRQLPFDLFAYTLSWDAVSSYLENIVLKEIETYRCYDLTSIKPFCNHVGGNVKNAQSEGISVIKSKEEARKFLTKDISKTFSDLIFSNVSEQMKECMVETIMDSRELRSKTSYANGYEIGPLVYVKHVANIEKFDVMKANNYFIPPPFFFKSLFPE